LTYHPVAMAATPPKLIVLSQVLAELFEPNGRAICISITDPGQPPAVLSERFDAILRLSFSDIRDDGPVSGPVLFSRADAARVLDFVNKAAAAEIIVVHCLAGISRSAGVALALAELNGWPVADLEKGHPLWNPWVRAELLRAAKSRLRRGEEAAAGTGAKHKPRRASRSATTSASRTRRKPRT
jgi:hypothetical protein